MAYYGPGEGVLRKVNCPHCPGRKGKFGVRYVELTVLETEKLVLWTLWHCPNCHKVFQMSGPLVELK